MRRSPLCWCLVLVALGAEAARAAPPPGPAYLGEVRPQGRPQRIVSLAPNLTEIAFALGRGGLVKGVTRFDDFPAAVADLPRVGGFTDPNLDAILGLQPDLVLCAPNAGNRAAMEALVRMRVPVLVVPAESLSELFQAIAALGDALGAQEEAAALADRLRARLDAVEKRMAGAARPGVLLVYGHRPLVAAGPNTFGGEMIRLAGGRNVLEGSQVRYPALPMEEVLKLAPEVILDVSMGGSTESDAAERALASWSRWKILPAVKAGRVHVLDSPVWFRPGPRLVEGVEQLAEFLHPSSR